jgi:hypothetical protein
MTPMQQDQQNQPRPPPLAVPPGYKPSMSPRANGALLVGLGILLGAINVGTLVSSNTFYPKLLIVGAALMPVGGWTLVTGIAFDKQNPVKPPTWWTVGAVLLAIAGAGLGVAATVMLQE